MIEQDELRRRIRAAMGLAGIASWEELAERTPFSRSLLKDLATTRGEAGEQHLRPIAAACHVPYAWFTVPSIADAVAGAEDASLGERVEALERRIEAGRQRADLEVTTADGGRLVAEVKTLVGSGAVGSAVEQMVALLSETGRRLDELERGDRADFTRTATDESRAATTAALVSAGVAGSTPPGDSAHGEGDASREAPGAPDRSTPRSEPGAGG